MDFTKVEEALRRDAKTGAELDAMKTSALIARLAVNIVDLRQIAGILDSQQAIVEEMFEGDKALQAQLERVVQLERSSHEATADAVDRRFPIPAMVNPGG